MDLVKHVIKLFIDNGIAFCHPHGIENDALMNAYILAEDLPKVQELLKNIHYQTFHTDNGNYIISI